MLRGFRWQLLTFVLALAVFVAAVAFRFTRGAVPAPRLDATPTALAAPTRSIAPTDTVGPPPKAAPVSSANVYREGFVGDIQRLNPLFAHLNPPDQDIASLIFEGLFAFNDYGETVPRLANELIISSDGLEYVVRLRSDILWQNGLPFSADDVVYTVALMSDPRYADYSPHGVFWQTVEAQKLASHLVRFRLAQPYSSFPALLTTGILPEHALLGTNVEQLARHPFNLSPIGTGAYQLAGLDSQEGAGIAAVRLTLSPLYRQRPEAQSGYLLHDLHFTRYANLDAALAAYVAGDIDALSGVAPSTDLDALPQSRHYRQLEASLGVLIFNWSSAPLEERRVRQALSLALDVPQLVQTHYGAAATFADSPYIPGSSAYLEQKLWTAYDMAEARELLHTDDADSSTPDQDAAGDEDSASSIEPTFTLIVDDSDKARDLAEAIAAQWRLLDLDFIVEALDAANVRDRLETGRFNAAIVTQRIGADPDLFRFWHPAQTRGNYGGAADNEIAEIIESARAEIYPTRRALLHATLQEVFAEQVIAIPLFYPVFTFVVRDSLEGIQLGYLTSRADRFRGIQHWRPVAVAS